MRLGSVFSFAIAFFACIFLCQVLNAQIITTVAGRGTVAYSGDGGAATAAQLYQPYKAEFDSIGNLYIVDYGNARIRKISTSGIITTIAGNAPLLALLSSGDGGAATAASLCVPMDIGLDRLGNIYIAERGKVRKINSSGIITTVAGTSIYGYTTGDGGPATLAQLGASMGIAIDGGDNILLTDYDNNIVRKVTTSGIISTIAGTGTSGFSGDGGPATAARLYLPNAIDVDLSGNIYISEFGNGRIRKINSVGIISTIAGNGLTVFSGDGGAATAACIIQPSGISIDTAGNVYISDLGNYRIRKVTPSGIISTIAGTGAHIPSGDGGPATAAGLNSRGIAIDRFGSLYVCDNNYHKIRKIDGSGIIRSFAGTGITGGGDGGPATSAQLFEPSDVVFDYKGNMYIADRNNHQIRKISPSGTISILAGSGLPGFSGDGGAATSASLFYPACVSIDTSGNVFVGENWRIRRIDTNGIIVTIAGNGTSTNYGDGGAATAASIMDIKSISFDASNNLFLTSGNRIRKINNIGIISTIAGTDSAGFSGDGGSATAALLNRPTGVHIDLNNNIYISDYSNFRVRKISTTGIITTVAGNGSSGTFGDSNPATSAQLGGLEKVTTDPLGNLYITAAGRVRVVNASGIISHIAGGNSGYNGDGIYASTAQLYNPRGLCFDTLGRLYVADASNNRIRMITPSITGSNTVCLGMPSTYSIVSTGGMWSSSNTGILTVGSNTGIVTGIAVGTASLSYYVAGSYSVKNLTVSIQPASITGTTTLCTGATTTLGNTTSGGRWSSSNTGIATVGSSTGVVSGVAAGTATISYVMPTGCFRTATITVNALPSTITGATIICIGNIVALSSSTPGGTWASSNNSIATVGSAGSITGVAYGTVVVSYTLSTGCYATASISVNESGLPGIINTIARSGLSYPHKVTTDIYGNVYIADINGHKVHKVSNTGVLTTIAGTGSGGYNGDGGAAIASQLYYPSGVAVDTAGNVYIADQSNWRIRKISTSGIISTIAGTGSVGYSGDGGQATAARIFYPFDIAVDRSGNIFYTETNGHRIRKISSSGIITTIAGNQTSGVNGTSGFSGDGGIATAALLSYPSGVDIDNAGNVYIADRLNNRIRKINSSGIITTIVGTGASGFTGDGGSATACRLSGPYDVAIDKNGNMFIADRSNYKIRKVATSGIIYTIAGDGNYGYTGDGGPATAARFRECLGVAVDTAGSVIIPDFDSHVIRKVSYQLGPITGNTTLCAGTSAQLSNSYSIGTWSSSNTAVATIGTTGFFTGVSAGTAIISYSAAGVCGTSVATTTVTVNPLPTAITGVSSFCAASTTTMANATSGGQWSTDYNYFAAINSASGVVTGVAAGPVVISYTLSTGCYSIKTLTVLPSTVVIVGANTLCLGSGTTLDNSINGGRWASSNTGVAVIGSISGAVSSITTGTTVISYTVTTTCGVLSATQTLSVNSLPTISISPMPVMFADDDSASLNFSGAPSGATFKIHWDDTAEAAGFTNIGMLTTVAGDYTLGGITSGDGGPATAAGFYSPAGVTTDANGNMYIMEGLTIRKISPNGIISHFAGNGSSDYTGDGGAATAASFSFGVQVGLTTDVNGNVYVSDANNGVIRKITQAGIVSTVVGDQTIMGSYSGDGGPATAAGLRYPCGIVFDAIGNLYMCDAMNHVIRKVSTSGIITTIAGNGTEGYSGDGGAATNATFYYPTDLCFDTHGNLLIYDNQNHAIRKVSTSGIISTVAGNGTTAYAFNGDGGPATAAQLYFSAGPLSFAGVRVDEYDNIYIAEAGTSRIRKVSSDGIISTFAGNGSFTMSYVTGVRANTTDLTSYTGITMDHNGDLLIPDQYYHVIRKISTVSALGSSPTEIPVSNRVDTGVFNGTITVYNGRCSSSYPMHITVVGAITGSPVLCTGSSTTYRNNTSGGTWSSSNTAIATVGTNGVVMGVSAGTSNISYAVVVGGVTHYTQRTITVTETPGITLGSMPRVCTGDTSALIAYSGVTGSPDYSIKWDTAAEAAGFVSSPSIITTIAGDNSIGGMTSGDGGAATSAGLSNPYGVTYDAYGNLYFCDGLQIRKVDHFGIITTIAGNGSMGYSGDGGPATAASVQYLRGLSFSPSGELYFQDGSIVRKVASNGIISTVVGDYNKSGTYSGDGGLAKDAGLNCVLASGIAFDKSGNLYIADHENNVIRKVNTSGIISTVAGDYSIGMSYSGDGGPATAAGLSFPKSVTVDDIGNIFIPDGGNHIIRKVDTNGIISTVAGNASLGGSYSGDGGMATAAGLNTPQSIFIDGMHNMYIADLSNHVVRKVNASGLISTFTGDIVLGGTYSGDLGLATAAGLSYPLNIVIDPQGSLVISDAGNYVIRKVTPLKNLASSPITVPIPSSAPLGIYNGEITVYNGHCSNTYPISVTITNSADSGIISGSSTVCMGATTTLTETVLGGSWSSSNSAIATIGSTGAVMGVSSGTAVISYTVSNSCGTAIATTTITVNPLPNAGTITGASTVCLGSSIGLSNSTTGGTWSSASGNVSVSGSTITGVSAGTAVISYTVSNSCGTAVATTTITVNPLPNAGTITGASTVCVGSSIGLSNSTTGGTWRSPSGNVSVSGSTVTGVSAGTAVISYTVSNSCGTVVATTTITVNPLPNAGTITGSSAVCVGSSIGLSNSTTGGIWSSPSGNVSVSGSTVTGVSAGTAVISYTVSNSCGTAVATTTITVNPLPNAGTITGASSVCVGSSIGLSNSTIGGVWNSASGNVSVSGGTVTGLSAGNAVISYTVSNSCGTAVATTTITVNPLSNAGTITGASSVCVGSSIGLSNSTTGGTWSSASGNVSVSGSTITGVSAGTAVISYSVSNSCGTAVATTTIAVNALPSVYTVTGGGSYCAGGSGVAVGLSNSASGISYQLIRSGSVVGTLSGTGAALDFGAYTAAGTYTVVGVNSSTSCQSTMSGSATVSILPLPNAGAISGASSVGFGSSITLTASVGGGVWSSTGTNATISSGGVVTGVSAGTEVISYTVTSTCGSATATKTITVNTTISGITGTLTACPGGTTTLSSTPSGGTWTSGNTGIATVGYTSGVVLGISGGTTTITYSVGGSYTTAVVSIIPPPAITGGTSVCNGQSITLSNSTTGGTWVSGNPTIATVGSASGIVTGISGGTTNITYYVGAGCSVTTAMAVNNLSPITGASSVCEGQSTTLSNVAGGGTWSSSDNSVATVGSSTGVVSGVSAGVVMITYTTAVGCTAITNMTVNASASISGASSVCVGQTTTLSNTISGGIWSTNNVLIASVGSATGLVTGVAGGSVIVSYTTGSGCVETAAFSVNSLAPITGSTAVCVGQTTSLSNTTSGGIWTSSDATIATIGSSTGLVGGVSTGAVSITYTTGAGCAATTTLAVNAASAIAGPSSVCLGQTITLTNAVSGGAWVSGNTTIATVDATTGVVTGVSGGAVTLSYTTSSGCVVTKLITVNTLSPIGGPTAVCSGQTITLTDATIGGTWMSAATGIATIGSASGLVNGISVGSAPITYTTPAGCFTTTTITVTTVASITGPTSTCVGQSITLSNATPGGVWISGNGSVASIGSSTGLVTGVSTGGVVMSYTIGGGCSAVYTVNVNAVGPISGATSVCTGQTTSLSNFTTGGRWTSSDITVASVGSSTGVVTGVGTGTTTISYTMPTGCVATSIITSSPVAATAGPSRVCNGQSITLTNSVSGGIWTSGNTTIATVGSATGIVNGGVAGSVVISYTTGSGCRSTFNLTVATISAIGGVSSVCGSQSITLNDATTGGTWSSSNLSVANVGTTGIVVGANGGGTAIITYSLGAGCLATKAVTINPFAPISGLPGVCVGQTITLTDAQPGGIWSSSNPASGSIGSATGIVTGRTTGVTIISYTLGSCRATQTVNVSVLGTISGILKTCVAQNTNLTNTGLGGLWSSSNTAIGTVIANTGAVTGVSAGTFIITYAIGTSCIAVATVTVNALAAITGPTSVCVGQTTTLSNTTPAGGTWSSGNNTIATIGSTTGIVTGVTGGTLNMSFTVAGTGCRITHNLAVNALSAITGATSVCQGSTATLTEVGLGTWSSSNTGVATIGASTGVATGVSAGTSTISFIVNLTGCTATKTFTVHPADVITGSNSVCISTPITLSNTVSGGTWTSTNPTIARVGSATGIVTGLIAGPGTTITYTTPRGCRSTKLVAVGSCRYGSGIELEDGLSSSQFTLIPNPNKGEFTVKGTFTSGVDEVTTIEVIDMLGQVVYRGNEVAISGRLNLAIKLENGLANGMYILNVRTETERKTFHFVVSK